MIIEKENINKAKNLLIAINKATFNDMLGQEMMALGQAVTWMKECIDQSIAEHKAKEEESKAQ